MTSEQIRRFREDYFLSWKSRKVFVNMCKRCYQYDISNENVCQFDQYGFIKSASRYVTLDELEIGYGSYVLGLNRDIAEVRGINDRILHPTLMDAKFPHVHWAYHCINNRKGGRKTIMTREEREHYYIYEARKESCDNFKRYAQVIFPRTYHRKWSGIDYMIQLAEELIKAYGETSIIDKSRKRKIVFFTGSGISRESGIPTFRDGNGLWEQYPVEMVASISGWRSDPEFVNKFYNNMRLKYTGLSIDGIPGINPNGAHRDIIRLVGESPFCGGDNNEIVIITQNVDDLHERALNESLGLGTGYESMFEPDDSDYPNNSVGGCECGCDSDCECVCCTQTNDSESEQGSEQDSDATTDSETESESETVVTETEISERKCPHNDCDDECECEFFKNTYVSDTQGSETENDTPVRIIHLHGELMKMCADNYKEDERYHLRLPYKKSLTIEPKTRVKDVFPKTSNLPVGNKLMRPYIVFFGEDVPNMSLAIKEAEGCDAFIIIGTSLQVYPAANLIEHVPYGTPIIYIDPNPQIDTSIYPDVILIKENATTGMRQLLNNWNEYIR